MAGGAEIAEARRLGGLCLGMADEAAQTELARQQALVHALATTLAGLWTGLKEQQGVASLPRHQLTAMMGLCGTWSVLESPPLHRKQV